MVPVCEPKARLADKVNKLSPFFSRNLFNSGRYKKKKKILGLQIWVSS